MIENKLKLLLGSDPEIFIKTKDNIIVGSEVMLQGDIEFDFGKIVRDGIQVEFNPTPANNPNDFKENINKSIDVAKRIANDINLDVVLDQVVNITQETMDSLSDDSKVFGCMPSYNAYDNYIKLPKDASKVMYRSGGGHIHISSEDEEVREFIINNRDVIVKNLDRLLGMILLTYENTDDVIKRRTYYGRAGEYRKPNYGLEYRVPSNIWLSLDIYNSIFILIERAIDMAMNNNTSLLDSISDEDVMDIINTGKKDKAETFINDNITFFQ